MVWPGDDQRYGGGQQPGWQGYPPPGGGYGGPPYGTGGYGGGYGGPPGPPTPHRSSPGLIVVVTAILVVVIGSGVASSIFAARGHKKDAPSASAAPAAPPGIFSDTPAPRLSPYRPSPPPSAPAKVPGWHAVVAVKHGVTYDVPASAWSVKSATTIVGFAGSNGKPQVAGSGAAIYKEGYCAGHSGSWRAQAAVTGYRTTDLAADAKDAARKWATFAYTPGGGGSAPSVTVSGTRPVDTGAATGQEATATVAVHDAGNRCAPPRGIVHAVAVPLKNGEVAVLVVAADQGVADAVPDADLQKIAASVRRTG